MIDRATVDKILDTVEIVDVIEDFITLKRRGANYVGLCPFHQDRTPSLYVSPSKGIFKCFACGKAGTALSFVMEHEHLSYPEALRYLAKKYNIEIEEQEENEEQKAHRLRYESLLIASNFAQKFFQDTLWNTERGKAVGLEYFRERKFSDETIRKFGLGFSPDGRNELLRKATAEGFKQDVLVDAGLCYMRDNGEVVDRFFDRVMFPVHSLSGKVIAFGGRTLRKDKTVAKYVNSPETEIYHKSNSIYGLYFAKNAISRADRCYMVEGYADVISMHQRGIENVVASSGTSLTVEQVNLIKRFTRNMTIIYDGDAAGIKAALRGIDLVLEQGMNVKVVLLPPDEDPDSFAKNHFKDEIIDYISQNEKDFIGFKCQLFADEMNSDPLRRSQIINDIIGSIAVIPDPITRNVYVSAVAQEFDMQQDGIFDTIKRLRTKRLERIATERERSERRRQTSQPQGSLRQNEYIPQPVSQSSDLDYVPDYGLDNLDPEDVPQDAPTPDGIPQAPALQVAAITDSYLAPNERELIYYLVKFGFNVIHKEENMLYGAEATEEPTVAVFIRDAMAEDELEFVNPIYRLLYDEYFKAAKEWTGCTTDDTQRDKAQMAITRHFIDNPDRNIAQTVIGIIEDVYQLTIKEYQKSLTPEEQVLGQTVPKAVILYKLRRTEQLCKEENNKLREAQHQGDTQQQMSIMRNLQVLMRVKNELTKALKRW